MNREILFRGKRIVDGKWIYGYYFEQDMADGMRSYIRTLQADRFGTDFAVDPNTVGQYTGLTDKNDNKIFEGDIVKVKSLQYGKSLGMIVFGIIIYDRGCFWVKRIDAEEIKQSLTSVELEHDIEVIGNIHDNPDMLKGGEK